MRMRSSRTSVTPTAVSAGRCASLEQRSHLVRGGLTLEEREHGEGVENDRARVSAGIDTWPLWETVMT